MNIASKIDNFTRAEILKLLNQCTKEQQNLFNRIYPEGISKIKSEKLNNAIRLCERTIVKNKEKEEK